LSIISLNDATDTKFAANFRRDIRDFEIPSTRLAYASCPK